jgi:hypothetical protein
LFVAAIRNKSRQVTADTGDDARIEVVAAEAGDRANIQIPGAVGSVKKVTICLREPKGHACLTLRPLTRGLTPTQEERLNIPSMFDKPTLLALLSKLSESDVFFLIYLIYFKI